MWRRRRKIFTVIIGTTFLIFIIEHYRHLIEEPVESSSYINDQDGDFITPKEEATKIRLALKHKVTKDSIKVTAIPRKADGKVPDNKLGKVKLANQTDDLFAPKLSPGEKQTAYMLMKTLHKTLTSSNLTYFIYSGTLLGSYRHHDLIPWDDDLDIFTDVDTKDRLIEELQKLAPEYTVFVAGNRLKFYLTSTPQTSSFPWTFPYVDISFYKDNGSNIYDYSDNQDMGDFLFVYEKKIIFPLHLRPLGDMMLNSPKDALANLRATYSNLGYCRTPHYLHRKESLVGKVEQKPCEEMRKTVPFVHRKPSERWIEETLKIGEEVIQTILVEEPEYAITDPYTLETLKIS